MITRHPLGRQDLRIKRRDKVLEIGPGHDPMFRSDVIADKFPHDDTHRCGKVLIYPHQQFIEADGEQLPFEKDAFDYVICNQVLEHADNPARFIEEMVRVGKRGYVETPSMLGELMFPKESHRWVILLIEDKLVFYEDIYILQCTKLKIGCLICKYRVFSLKIHIQGKIQVIQSQPQWLAFFIFFENFSENSAKSGFVW